MTDTLDTRQWQRLREAFDYALDLDVRERSGLLDALSAESPQLATHLTELLDAHDRHREQTGAQRARLLRGALDAIATPMPAVGERVGAYVLREELGRGGMGVVFRAERADGQVQQEVAIKVVRGALLDERALQRFRSEREIVASFDHPYIARPFDVGETADGSPYLVMERVKGQPLTSFADHHGLTIAARLELFLKVCEAVQHAHAKLVLHRDLKPNNILVTDNGIPKLIDFGIAQPLGPGAVGDLERTGTQQRFFSPANASPEQLRGERAGVACDVYQLGTVLYELLCGVPLFEFAGSTPAQIEQAIFEQLPVAPSNRAATASSDAARARGATSAAALARELRGDLDNIVLQCLRKPVAERYASVEQLADDVRSYLEQRPVRARGSQRWYRARKFLRRNRAAVAALAIFAAMIAAFLTVLILQSQRLQLERDSARLDRDRADRVAQFLTDVFTSADPTESLSRDVPVGKILDNARLRLQSGLADIPGLHGRLLILLAHVYLNLDDADTALKMLDQAKPLVVDVADADPRTQAQYYLRRGQVLFNRGEFLASRNPGRKALALQMQLGDSAAQYWEAAALEADNAGEIDSIEQGISQHRELLRQLQLDPHSDPRSLAQLEFTFADDVLDEHPEEARRLTQQAIDRLQKVAEPNDPLFLEAQRRMAVVLDFGFDRYADALKMLEPIRQKQIEVFGPRSSALGKTYNAMGHANQQINDFPEALRCFEQARKIYRELPGGPNPGVEKMTFNIATVYEQMGNINAAADTYAEAIALMQTNAPPKSPNLAVFRGMLGGMRLKQGRLQEAETLLAAAVDVIGYDESSVVVHAVTYAETLQRLHKNDAAKIVLERLRPVLEKTKDSRPAIYQRAQVVLAKLGGKG